MLQAGIPLVQAFDIVATGHENPGVQKLLSAIKVDLESGTTLAEALAKHPLYFRQAVREPGALGRAVRRP
jgi:type IV pilus assembly protein PilC